jgi:RNA polymerase sigma-B factor
MTQTAAPVSRHGDGYGNVAPLFVAYRALPAAHPLRSRLRKDLIAGYHPIALHIARKHAYRGENPDDLEQVATLALILAVDRFEPDRGIDFLIYEATAVLSQRLGRAPRPSEIAEELDVDVEFVLEALAAESASHALSLDEPLPQDDGSGRDRGSSGAAALQQVEPRYDLVEYRESLGPLLNALPERERTILLLRFFGDLTQTEIGKRVGVSQMHVSRLLTRTLQMLRTQLIAAEGLGCAAARTSVSRANRTVRRADRIAPGGGLLIYSSVLSGTRTASAMGVGNARRCGGR